MAAAHDPRPKLLAVGEHDPFRPPASAAGVTEGWADTELVTVAGADHFFAGLTARPSELLFRGNSLQAKQFQDRGGQRQDGRRKALALTNSGSGPEENAGKEKPAGCARPAAPT